MINKLIADISLNKDYEALCKSLVKDDWRDLLHDVILRLYERPEHLLKANESGYLNQYVYICIYNFFRNKVRQENLRVNCEFLDHFNEDEDFRTWWEKSQFETFERNEAEQRATEVTKQAVGEVTKLMMQGDTGAMVLWQASQTNVYTVSKRLGTSSYQINKTIKPIIKQIKRKLK